MSTTSTGLIGPTYKRPIGQVPPSLRNEEEVDFSAGFQLIRRTSIENAGLRGKKLWAVIACLIILWILALFALFCNMCIIVILRMNHRGMESMQFHTYYDTLTDEPEYVVQFTGESIDLVTVVTHNGRIKGYKGRHLNVWGSRVILSTNRTRRGEPSRLILQNGRCRIENVDDFLVLDPESRRPLFSAKHPLIQIDKYIQRISTLQIITNKIRAPIADHLKLTVDNLSFRGNEGNHLSAKRINISANKGVHMRTTEDGAIRIKASNGGIKLAKSDRIDLSPSPALSASVDGFRLCSCSSSGRLFVVPGNKPCNIDSTLCI